MLDDFGSAGSKVNPDGTFEGDAQPGRHRLAVWEMAPPKPNGYTRLIRKFASVQITVGDEDVEGIEVHIDPLVSTSVGVTVEDCIAGDLPPISQPAIVGVSRNDSRSTLLPE